MSLQDILDQYPAMQAELKERPTEVLCIISCGPIITNDRGPVAVAIYNCLSCIATSNDDSDYEANNRRAYNNADDSASENEKADNNDLDEEYSDDKLEYALLIKQYQDDELRRSIYNYKYYQKILNNPLRYEVIYGSLPKISPKL